MRPAKKARERLQGNWGTAAGVQCVSLASRLLLLLLELFALRLLGLGAERVVPVSALWSGGWAYGAVLAGALLLDWLLISPLLLGRTAYYWKLTGGENAAFSTVFCFFRRGYGLALRWRLSRFLRRVLWGALCYAPAALLSGYASLVRRTGAQSPLIDVTLLLCTLFSLVTLAAGFVALELLMLRYLPSGYLLAEGAPCKGLFRSACRIMRGRVGETAWLYAGFAGWFAACLLLFPYFYAWPTLETCLAGAVRKYRSTVPEEEPDRRFLFHRRRKKSGPSARMA